MSRLFNATITFLTAGNNGKRRHRRERDFGGIRAENATLASAIAIDMFMKERHSMKTQVEVIGVSCQPIHTPVEVAEAVLPGDVLDQVKAILGVPAADPRIGHKVVKTTGDYTFDGVVTAVIPKLKGGERFAVEDDRGLILIMNAKQCGFEI